MTSAAASGRLSPGNPSSCSSIGAYASNRRKAGVVHADEAGRCEYVWTLGVGSASGFTTALRFKSAYTLPQNCGQTSLGLAAIYDRAIKIWPEDQSPMPIQLLEENMPEPGDVVEDGLSGHQP
jgi:hypothetical protein